MRRRTGLVVGGAAAALALTGGLVIVSVGSGGSSEAPAAAAPPTDTAEVIRTDLVQTAFVDGTLSHGPTQPVDSRASGTLTWLPAAGGTVDRGQPLLRADEQPVVLLFGELPMYRQLAPDTVGADVEQFERNLSELGYTGFRVDERYTADTGAAVRRWQRDLHRNQTGTVEIADVIYRPGPVRVASRVARLGASATGQILTCTATTKMVTAQVPAQNTAWAVRGGAVDVVLPSGTAVSGVVADVGTQQSASQPDAGADSSAGGTGNGGGGAGGGGGAQQTTVPITVTIADQGAVGALDQAPVKLRHVLAERADVLVVPVTALLATIEGGYALEVVADGGGTRMIPVRTGLFADGRVEVSGTEVRAGLKVTVPT
ncbi:Putative peptidoglycan binding domain-containing protein [Parafrankia irregularis]|uniref:Putative peptidoglycan binding domain-containing protein n=1 Tax=Parafrankia irregularis TaxID=795642 RepID=A0A0S4QKB1_9ACTN|nr:MULTISPECIES: peptidoglycan-binding domain-containing protein [Parafrankia]MBE3205598.1 peptidoglycan-binding protein [Parafrankia sp. CH37]CUU55503.1 Putative peptidoglycan binding domain-containing protein [Parafrankia irregularis]